MLDSSGRLVDAKVTWTRTIVPGPMPQCGYFAQPDKPVQMPLDGPLLPAELDRRNQLPGQQRRHHGVFADGGARRQGPGASG